MNDWMEIYDQMWLVCHLYFLGSSSGYVKPIILAISFQMIPLLLQSKHRHINHSLLHFRMDASLGSSPREELDIFLKAFIACAKHPASRTEEGAVEIATEGGRGAHGHTSWHMVKVAVCQWWQHLHRPWEYLGERIIFVLQDKTKWGWGMVPKLWRKIMHGLILSLAVILNSAH